MNDSVLCVFVITDHQAKEYVRKAYLQMKSVSDKQVTSDGPEPFGKDLMVLCAETAYQVAINSYCASRNEQGIGQVTFIKSG